MRLTVVVTALLLLAVVVTAIIAECPSHMERSAKISSQKPSIYRAGAVSTSPSECSLNRTAPATNAKPLVNISVSNGRLIIETAGYVDQVGFFKPGDTLPTAILWPYSFTPMAKGSEDVVAEEVLLNKTYMKLVADTSDILKVLEPGTYEVIVWSNGREVLSTVAVVTRSDISITGSSVVGKPTPVCSAATACGEFKLVCYINHSSIEAVREAVYGVSGVYEVADASWLVLKWVDENIVYDKEKLRKGEYSLYDPLMTLKIRKGICMDYSALITTALISAGVEPVYIVLLNNINHAAPAVTINGSMFLLDQVLPPIEVGDYIDYVLLGSKGSVSLIKYWVAGGEVQLEVLNDVELNATDTYPSDALDDEVFYEAVKEFMRKHPNLVLDPKLKSLLYAVGSELRLYTPELVGYGGSTRYPVTVLYSPVFRRWWVEMLANYIDGLARKYYKSTLASRGYFWTTISSGVLRFIAINYSVPESRISVLNDSLRLEVSGVSRVKSLDVLVYKHGDEVPVAGVVPEGVGYANITLIRASDWEVRNGSVLLEFRISDLSRAVPAGIYDVIVWVNKKPVSALTLRLDRIYTLSLTSSSPPGPSGSCLC